MPLITAGPHFSFILPSLSAHLGSPPSVLGLHSLTIEDFITDQIFKKFNLLLWKNAIT